MSREHVAAALDKAAEALAEAAHALRSTEPGVAAGSAPQPAAPRPAAPSGHTSCPLHGIAFKPSKNPSWPSYCPERSDEPAPWSNEKGYCRINSKNAGEWLAIRSAAPASDEVPF